MLTMTMSESVSRNFDISRETQAIDRMIAQLETTVFGQRDLIEKTLLALLCEEHVLLEGLPGLAKTLTIKSFAAAVQGQFKRVQFTPDLLPADIIGTTIYSAATQSFTERRGPIFTNFLLADEINRAPAKVQSALLEAMQERQVTIGERTFELPTPFFVLATQNPIEQEGTYPLPEAQLDRFMMKLLVRYPSRQEELKIMDQVSVESLPTPKAVMNLTEIARLKELIYSVHVDEKIKQYILTIVEATRDPSRAGIKLGQYLKYGASPRASIFLLKAARALALIRHRGFVIPEDVKTLVPDILRHRLVLTFEAEADGKSTDDVISTILNHIEVP